MTSEINQILTQIQELNQPDKNILFINMMYDTKLINDKIKKNIMYNLFLKKENFVMKTKYKDEMLALKVEKDREAFEHFEGELSDLTIFLQKVNNYEDNIEYSDVDEAVYKVIKLCEASNVNYINEKGETILFLILKEFFNGSLDFSSDGCDYSTGDILKAIILNDNLDIYHKNNDGIDAMTYGKQLYEEENGEEWEECDYNEEIDKKDPYDDSLPLTIIEYRIKLDMKKIKIDL